MENTVHINAKLTICLILHIGSISFLRMPISLLDGNSSNYAIIHPMQTLKQKLQHVG